jgi:hypothetical protein
MFSGQKRGLSREGETTASKDDDEYCFVRVVVFKASLLGTRNEIVTNYGLKGASGSISAAA